MIFRSPQALLLLLLLPLFVAAWLRWRGRLSAGALALRLAGAALVVLALAEPIIPRPEAGGRTLVVLLDQSDSLGAAGQAALRRQADTFVRAAAPGEARVLAFGGRVAPAGAADALFPEQTDIAGALRAAEGLIGAGGGRVVLLSDGAETQGDALAAAQSLARRGIPVDTLAYTAPEAPEVWVQGLRVPPTLRVGERYSAEITLGSTAGGTAQLQLFDGTAQVEAQEVPIVPGENRFSYQLTARQPGIARLRAVVAAASDGTDRNNSAAATALVAPPPHVLLLEGRSGGDELRVALRGAGIEADLIPAASLPSQLSLLEPYDSVMLLDVPAGDLSTDQMATLREFVRSEGRGLVAAGGRSSFTLGAYKGTPLEAALPVTMDPPPRPERADVSLLLIIDKSASMGVPERPSKFDMARESAILATESLRQNDRLGVLAFDTDPQWVVPFQQIGTGLSMAQIQAQISSIQLGGGTDILSALDEGLTALEAHSGKVRHAVLLTDGRSFSTQRGPYQALVERARAANITLSAIAIGQDADTELLKDLATWGAGRYYFAGTPEDIPRLTMIESQIASAEPQVEGTFRADLAAPHPILRDFPANRIPALQGYVATTLKPEAELVLKSPEDDPVLAVWQYGLGRAVAWTPSVEAPWAENWANWPEYGAFWAELIRYTVPEPDSGPLQVRAAAQGDALTITADALTASGAPLDLADTQATITLPDGSSQAVTLRQTAPGRYQQTVALPADGPYAITVQQRKGDLDRTAAAGYVQPYSAEYLPARGGAELLRRISAAGGGRVLAGAEGPGGAGAAAPAREPVGLWPWLLLAAALLWPLEIALRRGWLRLRR